MLILTISHDRSYFRQGIYQGLISTGASPLFAKPEMGSVRFRVHKMRRRPWPSAARVRPASVPARTPRGTRTPAMTGRRVARSGLSSPPALTRRIPTKRSTLRLRGGRRTPLVAYAPSLSCAPPSIVNNALFILMTSGSDNFRRANPRALLDNSLNFS